MACLVAVNALSGPAAHRVHEMGAAPVQIQASASLALALRAEPPRELVIDEREFRSPPVADPTDWLWNALRAVGDTASPERQVERFCLRVAPTVVGNQDNRSTGIGLVGSF